MTKSIEQELLPNQRFMGNPRLKKAGVSIAVSKDQLKEIVKSQQDILYFVENYIKIVTIDGGLDHFKMYPYQKEMMLHYKKNRFSISCTARQMGKCVSHDTQITLRNKKTGKIENTTIGEFYNRTQSKGI